MASSSPATAPSADVLSPLRMSGQRHGIGGRTLNGTDSGRSAASSQSPAQGATSRASRGKLDNQGG